MQFGSKHKNRHSSLNHAGVYRKMRLAYPNSGSGLAGMPYLIFA